jgi:hypothetical protein
MHLVGHGMRDRDDDRAAEVPGGRDRAGAAISGLSLPPGLRTIRQALQGGIMEALLMTVVLAVLVVVPLFRIMKKAGLNPAWSFLIVIPGLGYLAVIGILAFAEWPNEPAGYR